MIRFNSIFPYTIGQPKRAFNLDAELEIGIVGQEHAQRIDLYFVLPLSLNVGRGGYYQDHCY